MQFVAGTAGEGNSAPPAWDVQGLVWLRTWRPSVRDSAPQLPQFSEPAADGALHECIWRLETR